MVAKPAQEMPKNATLSSSSSSSTSASFNSRISHQRICLESAFMEGHSAIAGTLRVVNLSFHKTVIVRWTINDWASTAESTASYVKGSSREGTDQFRFKLELQSAGGGLATGARVQFCLKYICEGEHWDSNSGANYVFQALPTSNPSIGPAQHTSSSAPLVIGGRGWGSSRGGSGSNVWAQSRPSGGQSGSGGGSLWGSNSSSSSGRQWGVSPSH